ncbi:MAG TPA: MFS transporter [Methanomassiliicoccales archaeon]|nr:MFS transporter [Methanomassiliicoccales archaeon]
MDDERGYRRMVLLITCIGAFMAPLDSTIVSVSLPVMSHSLNMDYASIIWVPTAYLAALGVLILAMGRLSDVHGRKSIFMAGFAIFVAGSFLCSIATNGSELIVFRIMQGVGAAFFGATSPAILTDVFPRAERGKALGFNAMSVYVGLSLGPPLGGFLTSALGWQSIFYINIPIGAVVILLAWRYLREAPLQCEFCKFDYAGLLTFGVAIIGLLVGLTLGDQYGWTSPGIVALFVVAIAATVGFVTVERRKGRKGLFDLSLMTKNRLFAFANISAFLDYAAYFGVTFMISFYLQEVLGQSVIEAGGVLLVMPVTMAILSPISGWLSDRIGSRTLSSAGMFIIGGGLLGLSALRVDSSVVQVLLGLFVIGVGMGIFSSPNTSAVMGSVERTQLGVASGTLATMRFVGQAASLAIMGAIVASVASAGILSSLFSGLPINVSVASESFVNGMSLAFIVSAAIAFIGGITSLARGPTPKRAGPGGPGSHG